ncbi:transmembrane protein 170B [Prionailurus iriomotensis]
MKAEGGDHSMINLSVQQVLSLWAHGTVLRNLTDYGNTLTQKAYKVGAEMANTEKSVVSNQTDLDLRSDCVKDL